MTVWDERYCVTAASTNSTTKQRRVVELAQVEGLLDLQRAPFESDEAWSGIAEVHDPAYVVAVRTGTPRHLAQSQGFTWSPAFAESVARIWQGHLAACRLAMRAGVVLHPVSGAHHAGYAGGSGFCTFNFLVGSARSLLAGGIAGVDAEFLRFRDRYVIGHVLSRGIPLVINLAGGYINGMTERLHLETVRLAVNARRLQRAGESLLPDGEGGA